jgi:starch phosphorylase
MYDTLENEIIPLYYQNRAADGLPSEWIARIKENIRTLLPQFSTRRMLKEYITGMYVPAIDSQEGVPPVVGDLPKTGSLPALDESPPNGVGEKQVES